MNGKLTILANKHSCTRLSNDANYQLWHCYYGQFHLRPEFKVTKMNQRVSPCLSRGREGRREGTLRAHQDSRKSLCFRLVENIPSWKKRYTQWVLRMSHSKEYLMPHSNWDIHIFYFFSSNFLIFKYVYTLYTVQTNFRKYLGPRSVAHPAFDARNCRVAVYLEVLRQHLKIAT